MGITGFSTMSMLSSVAAPLMVPGLALARRLGFIGFGPPVHVAINQANHADRKAPGRIAVPGQQRLTLRRPYSFLAGDERLGAIAARQGPVHRLKVVRVVEASTRRDCAGRMVISGRMADVCAELDRMAQRESQ